mgnify:CR=1 FL=1
MKAKMFLKSMIQGYGETVFLDQEGVPVHDVRRHIQPAAGGNVPVLATMPPGGTGAHQMAGGSGQEDEDGMGGFILTQGCRKKTTGLQPEFRIGYAGKQHAVLPLCGRQRANRVP